MRIAPTPQLTVCRHHWYKKLLYLCPLTLKSPGLDKINSYVSYLKIRYQLFWDL